MLTNNVLKSILHCRLHFYLNNYKINTVFVKSTDKIRYVYPLSMFDVIPQCPNAATRRCSEKYLLRKT